ncbi:hypothetical protein AVEN_6693-1 [Araneus ventricosus]|uniref:Uncharacterized protein n=1 Tax=Araneus ventricosus TaxID=182803 RepID=A0A4Y2M3P2_ARAVE|nr:hypothetical protein AVEN_170084-1 [Araneus ventricosus]GBN17748.1 hypothetical protein AVEN_236954-1 [Araneus ventricosus]GBN18812.1 hypothetical protein AVEN_167373-1 [Araneus ventricosus]GBN20346.1 hypothetical protein AVEN_6693-1 [Araneus ventricosus]
MGHAISIGFTLYTSGSKFSGLLADASSSLSDHQWQTGTKKFGIAKVMSTTTRDHELSKEIARCDPSGVSSRQRRSDWVERVVHMVWKPVLLSYHHEKIFEQDCHK